MEGKAAAKAGNRDLRLDFFRGLALWFIFIDHMPENRLSWLTLRNYGLCDAAEMFVFISGYTAALVYCRVCIERGYLLAAARVFHRVWTLYVTYIVLFIVYMAQIAYTARVFDNPLFAEEMGVAAYFSDPAIALGQALILKFRPVNIDVLPLYILLLLGFAVALPVLVKKPLVLLGCSFTIYVVANAFDYNLPAYPPGGVWFFNPFAWQFLFVGGMVMWRIPALPQSLLKPVASRWAPVAAMLAFSTFLVVTWYLPDGYLDFMPEWFESLIYPINKTNLDILRLLDFAALSYVALQFVKRDSAWLSSRWARPAVTCGCQSLHVFSIGVLLSFGCNAFLVHIDGSLPSQIAVTVFGIVVMIVLARVLTWYRKASRGLHTVTPAAKETGACEQSRP